MKYVKIDQDIKICVYGETLTAKVIDAVSQIDTSQNPTIESEGDQEEQNLAEDLDSKLDLNKDEAPKSILVSILALLFSSL